MRVMTGPGTHHVHHDSVRNQDGLKTKLSLIGAALEAAASVLSHACRAALSWLRDNE